MTAGVALGAGALMVALPMLRPVPVRQVSRVSVMLPKGIAHPNDPSESSISPDGRMIVFTGIDTNDASSLWIRPLDAIDAHALAGTQGGHLPFWSPDSRNIGFFAEGKLKRVPAAGGGVEVLADVAEGRGGAWGAADVILFSGVSGPLQRIPAGGGDPKPATTLAPGGTGHRFPSFLPDGRHFLFAALPPEKNEFSLFVGSLDGGAAQFVTSARGAAVYAPPIAAAKSGHLVFQRKGSVVAQPFDLSTFQLTGDAVSLGDAPDLTAYSARPAVSVSSAGTMAYLGDHPADTRFQWFDRSGREAGVLAAPQGAYGLNGIAFSPDGRRVAVTKSVNADEANLWILDVERGGGSRFTSAPAVEGAAQWSPDGTRLAFSSHRNGPRDIFVKPVSGAMPEEPVYASSTDFKDPGSWTPDGKSLVFMQVDPKTMADIWILPLTGERTPAPYLRGPFNEQAPVRIARRQMAGLRVRRVGAVRDLRGLVSLAPQQVQGERPWRHPGGLAQRRA